MAPWVASWLAVNPKYRPLLQRFSPPLPPIEGRPIWVHACSVGEVNTAKPIIAALNERWPNLPVALSVSTISGYRHAVTVMPDAIVTWCPFDTITAVRSFLKRLRPLALLLIETEIWPNMLRECRRSHVPVALVNGRISDKHFARYSRWRSCLGSVFQRLSIACAQNAEYAERLIFLGAEPKRVHVTGNTKFDAAVSSVDAARTEKLRREMGIETDSPVLIFGSTRPGDETLAAKCWKDLRDRFPLLRLVVAPRHIDQLQPVLQQFREPVLLRSDVLAGGVPRGQRVIVVDTMGELISFYATATVAVVGGSFYPGVNGHNPLEPAALGVPTVFGPYMRNFADPARELVGSGGARQVDSDGALSMVLSELLDDAPQRLAMASRAREAILRNQGAIERTLQYLSPLLATPEAKPDPAVRDLLER